VKLYEMGRLSGGAAAQLAGLPKPVFMTKLADYGVPVFKLSEAEIARDARMLDQRPVASRTLRRSVPGGGT